MDIRRNERMSILTRSRKLGESPTPGQLADEWRSKSAIVQKLAYCLDDDSATLMEAIEHCEDMARLYDDEASFEAEYGRRMTSDELASIYRGEEERA
jgi:hypothetical protein